MVIRKRILIAIVSFAVVYLSLTCLTYSQNSGEVAVFTTQFIDLHSKMQAMLVRAQQQAGAKSDPRSTLNLREEIFALQKLVHRLGEEAGRSNLQILKSGRDSNKALLLVSQGCEALSFVSMALDNFLETQDRAFLGLAKDADDLAKTIQKIL